MSERRIQPKFAHRGERGRLARQNWADGAEMGAMFIQLINEHRRWAVGRYHPADIIYAVQRFARALFDMTNTERQKLWSAMRDALSQPNHSTITKVMDVLDPFFDYGRGRLERFRKEFLGVPFMDDEIRRGVGSVDHIISLSRSKSKDESQEPPGFVISKARHGEVVRHRSGAPVAVVLDPDWGKPKHEPPGAKEKVS